MIRRRPGYCTRIAEYEIDAIALRLLGYCREDGGYMTRELLVSELLSDAIKRRPIAGMLGAAERAARRSLSRLQRAGKIRRTDNLRGWVLT